jgi:hypothetical protein
MRRGLLIVVASACALFAQTPDEQPAPPSRHQKLIEEIEVLASSEPPVIGIHAQVEAGRILKRRERAWAARFLRDAARRAMLISDAKTRGQLLPRVVQQFAEVDAEAAESVCASLPRREAGSAEDILADCYGELTTGIRDWKARIEAARRGLAAGAFDTAAYLGLLEQTRDRDPGDAATLLAAIIDGFPNEANASEIRLMLRILRLRGMAHPALARRGLEKAYDAVRSSRARGLGTEVDFVHEVGGKKVETNTVREALLFQIAGLAEHLAPDLMADRRSPLRQWRQDVSGIDAGAWEKYRTREKSPSRDKDEDLELGEPRIQLPETRGLSSEEIVNLARRQEDPRVRVGMLVNMLDGAKDLTEQRLVTIAWEAMQDTAKMNYRSMRLVAQSMLTRRLYQWGEPQKAAVGAQMLSETFDRMFNCDSGGCETLANAEDSPGEIVEAFAEYLKEHKIKPEDLGLTHRSLRLYWLLLELEEGLREKKE